MQGISVLVVDDDKDFIVVVKRLLESQGYAVTTSLDAIDAVDRIQAECFDLILTDANMPYRSGFDLIKTIRRNTRTKDIAIALVTGRRDKRDVEKGLECGADDYITKPVDPDLFLAKVESLLTSKVRHQANQVRFAETPINMEAEWDVDSHIVSVSEKGIIIEGPVASAPSTKLHIHTPLFELIDIKSPPLRVVKCEPKTDNPYHFITVLNFVGLTDAELQKVRFWVNTNLGLQHVDSEKKKKSA